MRSNAVDASYISKDLAFPHFCPYNITYAEPTYRISAVPTASRKPFAKGA